MLRVLMYMYLCRTSNS